MSERTVPSQVRLKPDPTNVRACFDLARPFTLVAPALGFISGALTAAGAFPREPWSLSLLTAPILGSLMAAVLNAGNNALNQIYDLEIDRVNKPKRPLPSGRLTIEQAWLFTAITYALALILAWLVAPEAVTNASGWSRLPSSALFFCYLMLRRPEEWAVGENHMSWAHMYRMMFVAQIGFAVAYLL